MAANASFTSILFTEVISGGSPEARCLRSRCADDKELVDACNDRLR